MQPDETYSLTPDTAGQLCADIEEYTDLQASWYYTQDGPIVLYVYDAQQREVCTITAPVLRAVALFARISQAISAEEQSHA